MYLEQNVKPFCVCEIKEKNILVHSVIKCKTLNKRMRSQAIYWGKYLQTTYLKELVSKTYKELNRKKK